MYFGGGPQKPLKQIKTNPLVVLISGLDWVSSATIFVSIRKKTNFYLFSVKRVRSLHITRTVPTVDFR